MGFDLTETYQFVRHVILSADGVEAGMLDLADYCEARQPGDLWQAVRRLDFAGDVARLCNWFEAVLSEEPPQERVEAFWFGLFNPVDANDDTSCGLYVSGAVKFDAEDETGDWACWTKDTYLPNGQYADSQVLDRIYRLVADKPEADIGEYVLCLGYAGLAIRDICSRIEPKLLLGTRDWRAVAVGFNSGDFVVLGRVQDSGWNS